MKKHGVWVAPVKMLECAMINMGIAQEGSDESLISRVDHVIKDAIQLAASDIHIEPSASLYRIRYRRDGILHEVMQISSEFALRFVTRLKVIAKLDISERRLPQDGRFQFDKVDIRINTCPTLFGEKIVLRLLNANKISLRIDNLGFSSEQEKMFLKNINRPQGMVLVTGPTGSGKTVTLYSALNYLNSIEKNISTVEDPVEIQLNGINQININPKIGLEFSTILRTLLRQDPDVIMLGEIRDEETAKIAIQAAQTGHLVLATLHTNSAVEALTRFQAMGITPHEIITSISLIVSQRLLRKLCQYCNGKGCQHCLKGYSGRTSIYEFFPMTEKISEMVLLQNIAAIRQQLRGEGLATLYESGMKLVQQGVTNKAELSRVI